MHISKKSITFALEINNQLKLTIMEMNFKPCSNKKLNEYTKIQLGIYKKFFEFEQHLINVINKYDGKVINQRFITALENVSSKFTCPYMNGEITEFVFSFTNYSGQLSIHYRGYIGEQLLLYKTNYINHFTIYGNDRMNNAHLYGKRLNASEYIALVKEYYSKIEKQVNDLIDRVENYDRVASVYKQAYDLLRVVKEYRSVCHFCDLKEEPYLHALKDVLIWN